MILVHNVFIVTNQKSPSSSFNKIAICKVCRLIIRNHKSELTQTNIKKLLSNTIFCHIGFKFDNKAINNNILTQDILDNHCTFTELYLNTRLRYRAKKIVQRIVLLEKNIQNYNYSKTNNLFFFHVKIYTINYIMQFINTYISSSKATINSRSIYSQLLHFRYSIDVKIFTAVFHCISNLRFSFNCSTRMVASTNRVVKKGKLVYCITNSWHFYLRAKAI